jgi:hypothetical protein
MELNKGSEGGQARPPPMQDSAMAAWKFDVSEEAAREGFSTSR